MTIAWWAFLLALGISFVFSLPIGIIQAITNTQIGLNVLTEFIFGYIQPGRPLALMIFKTYGYITMCVSLNLQLNLELTPPPGLKLLDSSLISNSDIT